MGPAKHWSVIHCYFCLADKISGSDNRTAALGDRGRPPVQVWDELTGSALGLELLFGCFWLHFLPQGFTTLYHIVLLFVSWQVTWHNCQTNNMHHIVILLLLFICLCILFSIYVHKCVLDMLVFCNPLEVKIIIPDLFLFIHFLLFIRFSGLYTHTPTPPLPSSYSFHNFSNL